MTYAESIFKAKRGFVIIGLTGYFNSGFKKVHEILASETKPALPACSTLPQSRKGHLNERIYDKLQRVWSKLRWTPFCTIDFSIVIFCFMLDSAFKEENPADPILRKIKLEICPALENKNDNLSLLYRELRVDNDIAVNILELYEAAIDQYPKFKRIFSSSYEYVEKMQDYGGLLRKFGKLNILQEDTPVPDALYTLPEAARRVIKSYRLVRNKSHFIMKSFKNPYEVEFFKRRYSEFYLIGTLKDFSKRDKRDFTTEQMNIIEARERNDVIDPKTKENIAEWVSHVNVKECLQKADYFINLNVTEGQVDLDIRFNIAKLISLIKLPGCIPPTVDERGMQIAMTARQVSRCLSRQVGAAVFDEKRYLVGVGWNDPPMGQVPCSLRTARELIESADDKVFSEHERDPKFIEYIQQKFTDPQHPFCFRQELPKFLGKSDKMSEYTRALHAEENAFFQALWSTNGKIEKGTLYVTDCTCNLCAKKAYQLGITRILYVDEYPGISISQTLHSGNKDIDVDYFEGATGECYFKLYTPLLPEKDLIQLYQ